MTYDDWKTTPPDEDPEGDHQEPDEPGCPDCGAAADDPCARDCGCPRCWWMRAPRSRPLAAPVAVFLGWQKDLDGEPPIALYNVTGGPLDGSTVTAERLRAEGIAVPMAKGRQ